MIIIITNLKRLKNVSERCPAGYHLNGAHNCTICPRGTFSGQGQVFCIPCPIWKHSPAGSTTEKDCKCILQHSLFYFSYSTHNDHCQKHLTYNIIHFSNFVIQPLMNITIKMPFSSSATVVMYLIEASCSLLSTDFYKKPCFSLSTRLHSKQHHKIL